MRRFLLTLVLWTAGCAAPVRDAPAPAAPEAAVPAAAAEPAAPGERWQVASSHLAIRVYRDGPMQRLGHNHVIVSEALEGTIRLREPFGASGFEIALPLDSLVVDDPAARRVAGAGFEAPVPPQDREATRRNMLGEDVLDAPRQGVLRLSSETIAGGPGGYTARVRVALAGGTRVVTAPFALVREGSSLRVESSFRVTHSELGLEPFSAALGALRVREDIGIDLRLEARRSP